MNPRVSSRPVFGASTGELNLVFASAEALIECGLKKASGKQLTVSGYL